jgi:rRNA maturation endonuclease Nob1
LYKFFASQSGLKGAEVVGIIASLSTGEITVHEDRVTTEETITDPITIEQPNQEELQRVTHTASLASELAKTNSKALNLAVVIDEFDTDTFDENVDAEQHVEEDDETGRSESDEELSGVTPVDVLKQVVLTGVYITQTKS